MKAECRKARLVVCRSIIMVVMNILTNRQKVLCIREMNEHTEVHNNTSITTTKNNKKERERERNTMTWSFVIRPVAKGNLV